MEEPASLTTADLNGRDGSDSFARSLSHMTVAPGESAPLEQLSIHTLRHTHSPKWDDTLRGFPDAREQHLDFTRGRTVADHNVTTAVLQQQLLDALLSGVAFRKVEHPCLKNLPRLADESKLAA